MARPINPIVPPKDPRECAPWLNRALRSLTIGQRQASAGLAAIVRGEVPDGSGTPLIDTSRFFFLPGLLGGQTAFQIDYNAHLLKLTQATPTAVAEPLLIIDSFGKLMRMTTQPFSITCTTTISDATVTTAGSFQPSGGPGVVPGMLISGTGIPANTFVRQLTGGSSLEMTNNATASGTVTVTFTTQVDIQPRTDDIGRDIEWLVRGGIRFTAGTSTIPFRITGEEIAPAANIAIAPYVFAEVGYIQSGSAFGLNLQFGGPNHGELSHCVISARTLWLTRSTASGLDNCVGISGSENPAQYGSGFGPAASLIVGNNRGPATFIGSTASGPILQVRDNSTGTSPNKTLGGLIFSVERDNTLGFYPIRFQDASGSGMYWRTAGNDNLIAYQQSNALEMFSFGRVSTWADSLAIANSFFHTLGTLNGGHRAYVLTSSGFGTFTRFGIRSAYTVIGNGNISSSDFPAPEASPTLLRVINGVTGGNDASVLVKIQTLRSGQTGDLLQLIGLASGQVDTTWNARNVMATGRIKTAVLFTDDPATIANAKLLGFDTSTYITAGQTRTLSATDQSGIIATDVNVLTDEDGDVITYEGGLLLYTGS